MSVEKYKKLIDDDWHMQGINASLSYIHVGGMSAVHTCPERAGYGYELLVTFFKDGFCDYSYNKRTLQTVFEELMRRYREDRQYLKKLMDTNEEDRKKLIAYYKDREKFLKLEGQALADKYKEISDYFNWFFGTSHLIESFSLSIDAEVNKALIALLEERNEMDKFKDYFNILIQTTETSFMNEYNKSLSNLLQLKRNDDKNLYKEIDKHVANYYWIRCNWRNKELYSKEEVLAELDGMTKGEDKPEYIADQEFEKYKTSKEKLVKELNLDQNLLDYLDLVDLVTKWQDDRKKDILQVVYLQGTLLEEIANRTKVDLSLLNLATPEEIAENYQNKGFAKDLQIRTKGMVVFYTEDGYKILTGKDYEEIYKIYKDRNLQGVSEVNGIPASLGKVVGRVKICLRLEDAAKIEEGDILVTSMTRPEFVPAMKKSAAVVTNEGGLTCHAAIVSRELGIPCIIGTKMATELLKDDELVEVDANHGVVKVIR